MCSEIWDQRYLDQLGGELAKAIEAITPDYQIGWEQNITKLLHPLPNIEEIYITLIIYIILSIVTLPIIILIMPCSTHAVTCPHQLEVTVTSTSPQIWQLCWQGTDALYLLGPGHHHHIHPLWMILFENDRKHNRLWPDLKLQEDNCQKKNCPVPYR